MDIDVHIADILGKKYRYPIDSDKGDIHPPLLYTANGARNGDDVHHDLMWSLEVYVTHSLTHCCA